LIGCTLNDNSSSKDKLKDSLTNSPIKSKMVEKLKKDPICSYDIYDEYIQLSSCDDRALTTISMKYLEQFKYEYCKYFFQIDSAKYTVIKISEDSVKIKFKNGVPCVAYITKLDFQINNEVRIGMLKSDFITSYLNGDSADFEILNTHDTFYNERDPIPNELDETFIFKNQILVSYELHGGYYFWEEDLQCDSLKIIKTDNLIDK